MGLRRSQVEPEKGRPVVNSRVDQLQTFSEKWETRNVRAWFLTQEKEERGNNNGGNHRKKKDAPVLKHGSFKAWPQNPPTCFPSRSEV